MPVFQLTAIWYLIAAPIVFYIQNIIATGLFVWILRLHLLYTANTIDTFKNTTVTVIRNKTNQIEDITNGSPLHEINLESKAVEG